MASKQTYECYVCKRNGFTDVRVYLDGKDENGKTVYKNEDMSPHSHKQLSPQPKQEQQQSKQPTELTEILDKLQGLEAQIAHLTKVVYTFSQQQQQGQLQK
jgi:hypothetical protein